MAPDANAAQFTLRATVDADLRTIRGTIRGEDCACAYADALTRLPLPEDDRTRIRMFPAAVERGSIEFDALPGFPDTMRFVAHLPERYGDVGALRGRGLMGNGGWYPQPVDGGGAPVGGTWDVVVRLPDGVVGVLNGAVGGEGEPRGAEGGSVRWTGTADRAALAVLTHARVSEEVVGEGRVTFVEHRRAEPWVHAQVRALIAPEDGAEGAWPLDGPPHLTIVEDLDLLRLALPAPGMVYLSDRAFRLTRPLARYHAAGVRRALYAALVPRADGWERDFVAALLMEGRRAPSPTKLLGWLSWNPVVDAILHDGTLPYYGDTFGEVYPETGGGLTGLTRRIPGSAAGAQVVDVLGVDRAADLRRWLLADADLPEAARIAGVPAEVIAGWALPYASAQDYRVVRDRGVVVERLAPGGTPAEVVTVRVDGEDRPPWVAGPGPDRLTLPGDARRVVIDPAGHVQESDRSDNSWPPRWSTILSGGIYDLSPTQRSFTAEGLLALRRQGDTHNLYLGYLSHDNEDLLGASVGWVRYVGPLVDRRVRTQRISLTFGPSLLDPAFRPTESGAIALGAGLGWAWDTRHGEQDTSGQRLSVGVGGGVIPGSTDAWASTGVGVVQLVPMGGRAALALRAKAGWASGEVQHRLLPLGGADNLRSVTDHAVVGNERTVGNVEVRWAVFRNASLPLPLMWLSELQLAPGIEAGALWREAGDDGITRRASERSLGLGATLGAHVVVDALGARPEFVGVSLAVPLAQQGYDPGGLQLYLDFTQAF